MVDRHVSAGQIAAWGETQHVIRDRHRGIRRNHVDFVGLDTHPIGHFLHGHVGFPCEEFGEDAVVLGIEVLDQHERHAGIGRKLAHQFAQCFDAAC